MCVLVSVTRSYENEAKSEIWNKKERAFESGQDLISNGDARATRHRCRRNFEIFTF